MFLFFNFCHSFSKLTFSVVLSVFFTLLYFRLSFLKERSGCLLFICNCCFEKFIYMFADYILFMFLFLFLFFAYVSIFKNCIDWSWEDSVLMGNFFCIVLCFVIGLCSTCLSSSSVRPADKPGYVLLLIITDIHENRSKCTSIFLVPSTWVIFANIPLAKASHIAEAMVSG